MATIMQQTVPTKNRGFTLIELLLVLALVVALTVAGIAAYQIQLRNFNVDKTALQMQQWLQAGIAFNVDCKQWPLDSVTHPDILLAMTGQSVLTTEQCLTQKLVGHTRTYMPAGVDLNRPNGPGPWSNYYDIGPYDPNDSAPPPSARLFYVKTHIGAFTPITENIARMIAGRLPNADIGNEMFGGIDQEFVRAYVNAVPSGDGGDNAGAKILNMEMVDNRWGSGRIQKPEKNACPAGTMPILVSAISSIDAGWLKTSHGGSAVAGVSKGALVNQGSIFDSKSGGIDWNKIPLNKDNNNKDRDNTMKDRFFDVAVDQPAAEQDKARNEANAVNKVLFISACVPDPDYKKTKAANTQIQTTASSSSSGISRY